MNSHAKNYVSFGSKNPALNFTFLFPDDWPIMESRGKEEQYDEVFVFGPRNQEDTYSLSISVRVTLSRNQSGRHGDIGTPIASFLVKHRGLAEFRKLSRASGTLAGVNATEIEIGYTLPLPLNSVKPRATRIIERQIFLEKDGRFYELIYNAVAEDYHEYLPIFRNAARTFEFIGNSARQVDRLVVMQMPALAVHEHPASYRTKKSGA